MTPESIVISMTVIDAFDALAIPYFLGGSLATAIHGIARSTLDADIVADLREDQAEALAGRLSNEFYVDVEMIRDAVHHRASFNLIHLKTFFKVDVFVRKLRAFDASQFARRRLYQIGEAPARNAYVATPEDNILAKLEWYRLGGEVSDRQWQDITNVIRIQGERLDRVYLRQWAGQLGVTDLLEQALQIY